MYKIKSISSKKKKPIFNFKPKLQILPQQQPLGELLGLQNETKLSEVSQWKRPNQNILIKVNFRRSEGRIREDVLEITPIGLTMEEVIEAIENNRDWTNEHEFHDRGVGIIRFGPEGRHGYFATINYHEEQATFVKTVGVQAIRLPMGTYQHPLGITHVFAHWAFDENGDLIDVFVEKIIN